VVGETRAASEMSVTFFTGLANMGEHARRAGHAVATRLIADCVTALVDALLHALHTYVLAMAPVRFVIT